MKRNLPFPWAVEKTAARFEMDLSRPLVLVSGGPDSVALLRVVAELGGEPAVLHVEHGLRGEESLGDARFVRELCETLDVACEVKSLGMRGGANLQERAREERYRLAEESAGRFGASCVAVGHTAGDVAETVLMNLARGAGLRGLAGIPPVRGRLARPLIERTRAEILAYLDALGQPYRTDSTNLSGKYARNRVRLEVLPLLEEMYPGASGNLARAAGLAREDLETLEEIAKTAVERRKDEVAVLPNRFEAGRRSLTHHAVRLAYREVAPEMPPLSLALVEAVVNLAGKPEGTRTLHLPGGVVAAARFGEELTFYRRRKAGPDEEVELRPGETAFAGWKVRAARVEKFDARAAAGKEVAYLDEAEGPYRVRLARGGDTIRPLGLGGTKTVFRAMMDRKVPKDLRAGVPVVVDRRGEVAWIFLGESGEQSAVGESTRRMLRLEVERA